MWCWTASPLLQPWNSYAYFRLSIDLPDRPTAAIVRISADSRYTLFVNGLRIHQGPARSFPHQQSYDTLDLADFLTAGPNSICAIVHQFGVPTAQSVYRDASGFLLDGLVETNAGSFPLHTPGQWLCRDATGWRKNVARLSPQLGFQEHFDADADEADWLLPSFDPDLATWKPPVTIAPVGGHPWTAMRARQAPLLGDEIVSFSSIVGQFSGENARGYKVAEDVFHLLLQETRKKAKPAFEDPDALLRDDDKASTLPPPPDGHFHLAVFDLGAVRTAHLILEIAQAAGDEIIDLLYLEELDKNSGPVVAAGKNAPGDRYRCRPGVQRWEAFCPKGFRYVALVFRNVEAPLKIRHVGARVIQTSVDASGSFECSDERLNAIYQAGVKTLAACMTDAYLDSPAHSQAQLWSDARQQFRAGVYVFEDIALLERGIVQIGQSQAADGSLHSHPPSDDPHGRSFDSMFAWIGTLWEHYFHTARKELLLACRPALDQLLVFLSGYERREGLLGELGGFAAFAQTAALYRNDFSAPLNLLYLQSLRWAGGIYEVLDLEMESIRTTSKADALAASIDKHFWDAKAKLWKDGFDAASGAPIDQASVYTNALALLLRLHPEAKPSLARDVILKAMNARRGKTIVPSPALAYCALDSVIESNLRSEAIDVIRAKWGAMLDRGATTLWEEWEGSTGSRCRGAAASPVYVLPQQILGVTPVTIGWSRVRIAPLVGALEFARGTIPSPRGPIRVEWEKAGEDQLAVRVELPEGTQGEFAGPLGETRLLESGASEFHT
jgi:hypothetical protein